MTDFATGVSDYRMLGWMPFPVAPNATGPALPGLCGIGFAKPYWRSQVCDLQMKAMQPDTSNFLPPSSSSIFDL